MLPSLNLASLVLFLHPKCLVEIQNAFKGGGLHCEVVNSHLYFGANAFRKQILVMEMSRETMTVLAFNPQKKRKDKDSASQEAPASKTCESSLLISSHCPEPTSSRGSVLLSGETVGLRFKPRLSFSYDRACCIGQLPSIVPNTE